MLDTIAIGLINGVEWFGKEFIKTKRVTIQVPVKQFKYVTVVANDITETTGIQTSIRDLLFYLVDDFIEFIQSEQDPELSYDKLAMLHEEFFNKKRSGSSFLADRFKKDEKEMVGYVMDKTDYARIEHELHHIADIKGGFVLTVSDVIQLLFMDFAQLIMDGKHHDIIASIRNDLIEGGR